MSIDYTDSTKHGKAQEEEVLLTTSFIPGRTTESGRLRPQTLADYNGQGEGTSAHPCHFHRGAPGGVASRWTMCCSSTAPRCLGKTTLAAIIANEMGVTLRKTSGPAIEKPKDLAGAPHQSERKRYTVY